MPHLLLHFSGELGLKGREPRKQFTDRLVHNLKDALESRGIGFRIERRWSRIVVESEASEALEVVSRVFGVKAVAVAERREWRSIDDLLRHGEEIFAPEVAGRTFAVRVRKGEEATRVPFRSPDLERQLGSRLSGGAAGVRLRDPEVEARLELQGSSAYFFARKKTAEGGLPVGTGGRALALFSGGFDSPVAAWQMLRRGVRLDYCFFNLAGRKHLLQVLDVLGVIADRWSYGYRPRLHVVDFQAVANEIREAIPERLWQVVLKRQMLRAAALLAPVSKTAALVTGESIAQVSSQTLTNLAMLDRAVELSILRPLLTWNKEEILAAARRIGTHDRSRVVPEYCALDGRGTETHGKHQAVAAAETALDETLWHHAVRERLVLDPRSFEAGRRVGARLESHRPSVTPPTIVGSRIPSDARLLDLRGEGAFAAWHPKGAIRMAYPDALESFSSLERDRVYVAYCEIGLKSAHLAEVMVANGYDCRPLDGGARALRRHFAAAADPLLAAASSPAIREAPAEQLPGRHEDRAELE